MALAARSSLFLHSTFVRRVSMSRTSPVRTITRAMGATIPEGDHFTMPDQPARFAKGKAENNARMLTTDFYDGSFLKDQRVLVTGGNRGIGLALVKELVECGANVIVTCRSSNDELASMKNVQVIEGCDVTDLDSVNKMTEQVTDPVDIVINNAGYFYEPLETIDTMNFEEQLKMIDVCAVGPLRVSSALFNAGKIMPDGPSRAPWAPRSRKGTTSRCRISPRGSRKARRRTTRGC